MDKKKGTCADEDAQSNMDGDRSPAVGSQRRTTNAMKALGHARDIASLRENSALVPLNDSSDSIAIPESSERVGPAH